MDGEERGGVRTTQAQGTQVQGTQARGTQTRGTAPVCPAPSAAFRPPRIAVRLP